MFMNPETEPAELLPISAEIAQNELCDRYKDPAPPAKTMLATLASATTQPAATKTAPAAPLHNKISNPTAHRRSYGHGDEGQHRVVRAVAQIKMPGLVQINKEPAKEDIGRVAIGEITERCGQNVSAQNDTFPT